MNVYRILFDWTYKTFKPILSEDAIYDMDRKFGIGKRLLKEWETHCITGATNKPLPAFFTTFSRAVVGVTQVAVTIPKLRLKLEECGELLPVIYNDDVFWMFNCLNVVAGALDPDLSQFSSHSSGRKSVTREVFRANIAIDKWFFCVPESCVGTYATQAFYDFYHEHQLTGLEFAPKTAFPPNENLGRV